LNKIADTEKEEDKDNNKKEVKNMVVYTLYNSSDVQSVIFDKKLFTSEEAKKWLKKHGFKSGKIDKTEDKLRFRQKNPSQFKRFRTKPADKGVKLIIGFTE